MRSSGGGRPLDAADACADAGACGSHHRWPAMARRQQLLTLTERMARIRKTDTRPEMIVRQAVHALGYRFRLHRRDLPGSPDLVLPRHRKIIFVHGCFWHRHDCRDGRKLPNSKREYWGPKLARNAARDAKNLRALSELGWDVLVLWECELKNNARLTEALRDFLQCPAEARLQASRRDQAKRRPRRARPPAPRAARR